MQFCQVLQKNINCESWRIMNNFLGLNVFKLLNDYLFTNANTPPKIYSALQTIDLIINDKLSVARFGDGEFDMMLKINHPKFQVCNDRLCASLYDTLNCQSNDLLVCIPNVFEDRNLNTLNGKAARHWKRFLMQNRKKLYNMINFNKTYGDALFTRHYLDLKNKGNSRSYFQKVKGIWRGRKVVIIEGKFTRFGVRNDLLDCAASVSRILCPERNAYERYAEILDVATKEDKDGLFLLALGPTATVLACDLSKKGYQAIDIGHLDIEYEWFLQGAKKKVKVENKYVNETEDIINYNTDLLNDSDYERSIKIRIY